MTRSHKSDKGKHSNGRNDHKDEHAPLTHQQKTTHLTTPSPSSLEDLKNRAGASSSAVSSAEDKVEQYATEARNKASEILGTASTKATKVKKQAGEALNEARAYVHEHAPSTPLSSWLLPALVALVFALLLVVLRSSGYLFPPPAPTKWERVQSATQQWAESVGEQGKDLGHKASTYLEDAASTLSGQAHQASESIRSILSLNSLKEHAGIHSSDDLKSKAGEALSSAQQKAEKLATQARQKAATYAQEKLDASHQGAKDALGAAKDKSYVAQAKDLLTNKVNELGEYVPDVLHRPTEEELRHVAAMAKEEVKHEYEQVRHAAATTKEDVRHAANNAKDSVVDGAEKTKKTIKNKAAELTDRLL